MPETRNQGECIMTNDPNPSAKTQPEKLQIVELSVRNLWTIVHLLVTEEESPPPGRGAQSRPWAPALATNALDQLLPQVEIGPVHRRGRWIRT